MYAIIECGGKQYKVAKDELVRVEKLDAEVGANVELKTLLVADDKGNVKAGEAAKNAKVLATVNAQGKAPKILVFHYKSKKQIRKRQGHRQPFTELKIVSIEG
ncbi:MAG: 50S ribosomal protein L21 [Clostridia bacterium]|nr:50S ribosomal protein L21 [Clostridia bacterium]